MGLALLVYRRSLAGYFAPDDFILLERTRGLLPAYETPWRVLSGTFFWNLCPRLFDGDPFPYHVVLWLLHGLNTGLLFALAGRLGASTAVAALAAGGFGTTRLAFTAVYPASSAGEGLALAFTFAALLLLRSSRGAGGRVAAVASFALGLLSKESVALLPLALIPARGVASGRRRALEVAPLLGLSLLWIAFLAATGVTAGSLGGEAYAWRIGPHFFANLARYTGAALDPRPAVADPDAPHMAAIGAAGLLAMGLLAWRAWPRTRLPAVGLVGWAVGLAPVLPLLHTRHLHYAYAPWAFLALALAALALWPVERLAASREIRTPATRALLRSRSLVPAVAGALLALYAAHAEIALARRHAARIASLDLPFDSLLRKMAFARRAIEGVRAGAGGDSVRVALVVPPSREQFYSVRTGQSVSPGNARVPQYDFLTAVLDSGRAIRAVLPGVRDVRIVRHWTADLAGYLVATNWVSGHVEVLGRGAEGHERLARLWMDAGLVREAAGYLEEVLASGPDDQRLRLLLDEARLGLAQLPGADAHGPPVGVRADGKEGTP
ncbi:MAG: hypothetical protein HZC42_08945 [Candidatus Eisenbacteria bacterium]|nr:hypothetical protein [Candidatus Eisenbacteria bacterium]